MCQMNSFKTAMICVVLISFTFSANSQSAASLLTGMDQLMSAPKDKEANVKMVLKDRSGKEKVREAIMMQKGQYKKLYRYTFPEKQIGYHVRSDPGHTTGTRMYLSVPGAHTHFPYNNDRQLLFLPGN